MTEKYSLSESQLEAFDIDFRDWPCYEKCLRESLDAEAVQRILDVGGGNGRFLDKMLSAFPNAHGILLDNAQYMLDINEAHPRKSMHLGSALALDEAIPGEKFDLITINVLLHHLIDEGEDATAFSAGLCVRQARDLLSKEGRILVYEQVYEGYIIEPGWLVYKLTSVRNPVFSKLVSSLGANTAGTGVRFRSREGWHHLFRDQGLLVLDEFDIYEDNISLIRRMGLNIRWVGAHLFVLGVA